MNVERRVRVALAALVAACGAPRYEAPPRPRPCASKRAVRVVDPAATPVAGARVRMVTTYLQCGPSGLPEGCGSSAIESPTVSTDASGIANVCVADPTTARLREAAIEVEHLDWPRAHVDAEKPMPIVIGPAHTAIVEHACSDADHVHVTAHGEGAADVVWAKPMSGRFRLDRLGPWRYWVRSHDDRSGQTARCPALVRILDASATALVLDRSDAAIERPDFAGTRATVRAFRSDTEIASATLDAAGRAIVTLPEGTTSGTAFCLRLDDGTHCEMTYARAGEVTRPLIYLGRGREIEANCGTCSPGGRLP